MIHKALSIAGSDCSGGAGIQADLKTFSVLKVYGMSVITALTAQNTKGISEIMEVDPVFVALQLEAVFSDIPVHAAKTGMLLTAGVVEAVAGKIRQYKPPNLVVDPVMMGKSGTRLLHRDAFDVFCKALLPLAVLVTPNTDEAEVFTGKPVHNVEQMEEAARQIHQLGPGNVLIKGGHLKADAVDVFFDGGSFSHLSHERIPTRDSHGTGCVLSAAITAQLALGKSVREAVALGKDFVTLAIRHGIRMGTGQGPCDPLELSLQNRVDAD